MYCMPDHDLGTGISAVSNPNHVPAFLVFTRGRQITHLNKRVISASAQRCTSVINYCIMNHSNTKGLKTTIILCVCHRSVWRVDRYAGLNWDHPGWPPDSQYLGLGTSCCLALSRQCSPLIII